MRKTKKKKLTLNKLNIASMQELQSIKGKSGGCSETCGETCGNTCETCETCSGKTHPIISLIFTCFESLVNC